MKSLQCLGMVPIGLGQAGFAPLFLCSPVASAAPQARASTGASVTTIRVNGESSFVNLSDPVTGSNGFLNVGRDRVGSTTTLDFSYVTPTSDPDIVILVHGAGEIPNTAFTTTNTTAELNVVTPFPVIRCEIDLVTGDFSCADTDPVAFDLTWVVNGYETVQEHIKRLETLGPLTVRSAGSFHLRSALVNGSWTENAAVDISGNLLDTRSIAVPREIAMRMK
jgi:hypothetical protein